MRAGPEPRRLPGERGRLARGLLGEQSGFTLVEMVTVVAVIGILASVAIPAVRGIFPEGQTTVRAADLREATVAVVRYLAAEDALPASGGEPSIEVRDADGDGVVRVALDTAAPDGSGSLPGTIDVTCTSSSTALADAVAVCFARLDLRALREAGLVKNTPFGSGEDVGASYDDSQSSADWLVTEADRRGRDVEVYVKDAGSGAGTPFPPGVLTTWLLSRDGRTWVFVNDAGYHR